MERELIHQINQAVDRGEDQVKEQLLTRAEEVKRFIEVMGRREPMIEQELRSLSTTADEKVLIPRLLQLLQLCILQMTLEEAGRAPKWLVDWYTKAQAWHFAVNLELWNKPPP